MVQHRRLIIDSLHYKVMLYKCKDMESDLIVVDVEANAGFVFIVHHLVRRLGGSHHIFFLSSRRLVGPEVFVACLFL